MGIFGKLFGSDKVISKTMDGIDAVIYTKEEKAENFQKLLKLYEPFKIAQRLLAMTFGIPYALAWVITFIMAACGINIDEELKLLSGTMGVIVGVIVGFYFGGGMINSIGQKDK